MPTYKELLAQRDAIDKQIADARRTELNEAIGRAREIIATFGLTKNDVFPGEATRRRSSKQRKAVAKYVDPATGKTWSGRGRSPKWLEGRNKEHFLAK